MRCGPQNPRISRQRGVGGWIPLIYCNARLVSTSQVKDAVRRRVEEIESAEKLSFRKETD